MVGRTVVTVTATDKIQALLHAIGRPGALESSHDFPRVDLEAPDRQEHGHANIKTTDAYLNATRIGIQESMRKFEEFRKTCTPVAQTSVQRDLTECDDEPLGDEEVLIPPSFG